MTVTFLYAYCSSSDNLNPAGADAAIVTSMLVRIALFPYYVFQNYVFGMALETILPVV